MLKSQMLFAGAIFLEMINSCSLDPKYTTNQFAYSSTTFMTKKTMTKLTTTESRVGVDVSIISIKPVITWVAPVKRKQTNQVNLDIFLRETKPFFMELLSLESRCKIFRTAYLCEYKHTDFLIPEFLDVRILCRSTAFENQFTLLGLPDPSDKSKSGGRFNLTNLGRPTPGPPVNADTCDCDQVCRMKPYFYRQLQKLLDYGSLILATLKKSPQIFLLDVRMSVCKWTPIPSLNPVAEPWLRKFLSKLFFISRWNSSSAYLRSRSPSLRTRTIPPPTSSYKTFLIFPFSWGQSSTSTTNKVQFYKISLTCLNASLTLADKCSYFLLK